MPDTDAPAFDTAATEQSSRRKPWQAPQIEDVSVAMKTAKVSSSVEYGSGKNGS